MRRIRPCARGQFTDRAVHVRGALCSDQFLCQRPERGERIERMLAAYGTAAFDQGRRKHAETGVDEPAVGGVGGALWQWRFRGELAVVDTVARGPQGSGGGQAELGLGEGRHQHCAAARQQRVEQRVGSSGDGGAKGAQRNVHHERAVRWRQFVDCLQ